MAVKGIPNDFPVRVVREDNTREGLLFAGTEFGMFISFDDGINWKPFQQNLPIVPITDIKIFRDNLNISTLGRSFWIMKDIGALRYFNEDDSNKFQLYPISKTINDEANIYFTTPNLNDKEEVKLSIYNSNQEMVYERKSKLIDLPVNALGIRKTNWNVRHDLGQQNKLKLLGPRVSPGNYDVVLEYAGKKQKQNLTVALHPNLATIGTRVEHLKTQEELSLKTATLLLEIQQEKADIKNALSLEKSNRKRTKLNAQLEELVKGEERYDKPKLENHVSYLYQMITDQPQALGNDAFVRYTFLRKQFDEFLSKKR